ncbi:MAG: tetratricopeptide repeat protein [Aquabacterium sp.]
MTSSTVDTNQAPSRIDRLWQYLAADPANTSLLRDIAREGMGTGAHEQALKALAQLAELGMADANDAAATIHVLLKLGRVEQACEHALQAREKWPEDGPVRVETGRAMLNARRFDDVLTHCAGDFDDAALAQMAGEFKLQALWHLGETDAASELASHLVAQFPDNPRLVAQYSALLYDQERSAEAFEAARRAYTLSPQQAYSALHVLASERLLQRDLDGAMKLVDEAQRYRTDDGRVWLIKGSVELMAGKVDDAIVDLKRALSIYPDHPGTHLTLAWVYITRGELDQAEATAHNAIEASPAFAESHGTLAVVYAMKGQEHEAKQSIRRATLLDKTGFSARYAQSLLDGNPPGSVEEIYKDLAQRVKI